MWNSTESPALLKLGDLAEVTDLIRGEVRHQNEGHPGICGQNPEDVLDGLQATGGGAEPDYRVGQGRRAGSLLFAVDGTCLIWLGGGDRPCIWPVFLRASLDDDGARTSGQGPEFFGRTAPHQSFTAGSIPRVDPQEPRRDSALTGSDPAERSDPARICRNQCSEEEKPASAPLAAPGNLLQVVLGQTIENQTVVMDGKHFIDCSIVNCVLEYSGQALVMESTQFSGCSFRFKGEAALTLNFLQCFGLTPEAREEVAVVPSPPVRSQRPN